MIMRKIKIVAAAACMAALVVSCGTSKVENPIAQIGRVTIDSASFDTFRKAARVYPAPFPNHFPGSRGTASFMAECEAIYQATAKRAAALGVTSTLDWEWKKKYFTATLFFDLLGDNLGFTNAELESRYNKTKESFETTVKTEDGQDSTFIQPFEAVKRLVADNIFYEKHEPDSAFIARLGAQAQDSAALRNHWLYSVRSNPADFYMRLFIKEQTGVVYSDSVEQIYGEGKYITPEDLEVIRSWVPESRRNMRMKELVEWLYKWKSFSERATKLGLTNTPEHKNMQYWALRMEHAIVYLEKEVMPKLPKIEITESDTCLAKLSIFDMSGRVTSPSVERITGELESISQARLNVKVDSAIYNIRKNVKVTWMQNEHRDERGENPAALLAKADSLRDAAADAETDEDADRILEEAESLYRALTADFAFTAEGRRAYSELAKINLDKYNTDPRQDRRLLSTAINYYRRGQVLDTDDEARCNSSFMIGFTYDEHLKNFALAEANYKWILRHTPACNLITDAEFMLQHLDEPMTSIEEIQGQSIRQGRKVEFEEEITDEDL